MVSIDAALPDHLAEWVAAQRWYSGKGAEPRLERIGGWTVHGVAADGTNVRIVTHYLLDTSGDRSTLYQVPLTERSRPLPGVDAIESAGGRYIYDAPTDPAYATEIIGLMLTEESLEGVRGHRQPGTDDIDVVSSHVLRGEQSNTSIICKVSRGKPVIVKVFRVLHHGDNPDVTLQSAIAAAGSLLVPTSIGYLSGSWTDESGTATGHLAFAQEFLPGVEDAWRVALSAAAAGEDFSAAAYGLGVATARVHATLASVFPTHPASPADVDEVIASMNLRLEQALDEVPTLQALKVPIQEVFEAARRAPWPSLQRIHGDFHLGQVLSVPGRGWVLLDFEGEPLRPMSERSHPDVTLRDVAGMLRSFDYAAGSVALSGGDPRVAEWAVAARHAFVDGYVAESGHDVHEHRALLDAFELDKALYEAVYEARNRPGWLEIPATGIRHLAERARTTIER